MPDWWATSDALRDVLVDQGRLRPPQRRFDLFDIKPGWLVFDNAREPVGRVDRLDDGYLVVRRSFWRLYLWFRLYVPTSAVLETHEGTVLLNVPRSWLPSMGWSRPPRHPAKRPGHP